MKRVLPAHVVAAAAVAGLCAGQPRAARARRRRGGCARRGCARARGGSAVGDARARRAVVLGGRLVVGQRPARRARPQPAPRRRSTARRACRVVDHRRAASGHVRAARLRPASAGSGRAVSTSAVQLELPLGRSPPQGARREPARGRASCRAGPTHGFDERTWLRRQGVHVVLQVDEWRVVGRRGGLGGVADRAPRLASPRVGTRPDGRTARGPRRGRARRRQRLSRRACRTSFRALGALPPAGRLGPERRAARRRRARPRACCSASPRGWAHLGALAAIGAYVLAVGPQPSVIRAAVSGAAVSLAWLAARERDPWHVLLLAAVVLLALEPVHALRRGLPALVRRGVAIFLVVGPLVRVLEGYPVPAVARRGGRGLGRVQRCDRADPLAAVRRGAAARRRRERARRAGGRSAARAGARHGGRRPGRAVARGRARLAERLDRRLHRARARGSSAAVPFAQAHGRARRSPPPGRSSRARLCLAAMADELKPAYLIAGSDRPKVDRAVARLRARFDADAVELHDAAEHDRRRRGRRVQRARALRRGRTARRRRGRRGLEGAGREGDRRVSRRRRRPGRRSRSSAAS